MARALRRRLLAIAALALLACEPTDGLPANYQPVVINAILVANQPLQTFTLHWAPTHDAQDPSGGPAPGDVNLWIVSSDNDSTPLVGGPVKGSFAATLTPKPGGRYLLRGTILGASISASTTVPSLVLNAPRDGDTLHTAILDPHSQGVVPVLVTVTATGALGYGESGDDLIGLQFSFGRTPVLVSRDYLQQFVPSVVTNDTVAAGHSITVTAFDSSASTFYGVAEGFAGTTVVGGTTTTNISGALGIFGSSTPASAHYVIAR